MPRRCRERARSKSARPMTDLLLHDDADGTTTTTAVGDRVIVELSENPTTGYRWELDLTGDALIAADSSYQPRSLARTGGGGTRVLMLIAAHVGTSVVRARLRRSWEAAEQAIEQHAFTIRVTERTAP